MRLQKIEWAILAVAVIVTGIFLSSSAPPQASPRLVSVQQIPQNIPTCEWNESAPILMAALQQGIADLPITEQQEREAREARAKGARMPLRTIRDTAPTYSAVAVDVNSD